MRVVGRPSSGDLLAGYEVVAEVLQADGTWIALQGLCAAQVDVRADEFVTVHLTVEVSSIEVVGALVGRMQLAEHASWWRRLLVRIRGQV
jgi:hypothetical protein